MITLVVAINSKSTIGLNGEMPWRNKEDLKHFKNYTMGKKMLMGRKTFEGLPKTLEGRDIYVVTRQKDYPKGVQDLTAYLENNQDDELIVAGGGEIYKIAMPYADKIVLSIIHDNDVVGDTFFPDIDAQEFREVKREVKDTFTLVTYERRSD